MPVGGQGTVLLNTAEELKSYSNDEESLLESQLKAIADAGVNVLVTGAQLAEFGVLRKIIG